MKSVATKCLVLALLTVLPTLVLAQMGRGGMGGGGGMGRGMSGLSMGSGVGQSGMGGGMGQGQSMGSGMGNHGGMGQGQMGSGMGNGSMNQGSINGGQNTLTQSQMRSGAFQMLQQKTGMSAADLQQRYASSGARNFGQFASAMVVSKNLGLNSNQVLSGMKNQSLGKTLQDMGVSHHTAKSEIKKAQNEIKKADESTR